MIRGTSIKKRKKLGAIERDQRVKDKPYGILVFGCLLQLQLLN